MTQPRFERLNDPQQAIRTALHGLQAQIWTALPAVILSVDLAKMTAEVQPTIQARVRDSKQNYSWVTMPPCVDCPLMFPSGGGFTLTFPVAAGDECLIVFASRCIDGWWQSGGVQQQIELRMHDLSDGFVLLGPRSQPRVLANVSPDKVQLRNDAGTSTVSINGAGTVAVVAPAVTITAPSVQITASSVQINANVSITGTLTNNGVNVGSTHTHGGVDPGSGNTGGPS